MTGLLRLGYTAHGGTVVMAAHNLDFAVPAGAHRALLADGFRAAPDTAGPGR